MRLANFAKLTAEERDAAWAKMDRNRRNALVGKALDYKVVAHNWPCFNRPEGEVEAEIFLPLKGLRQLLKDGEVHLAPVYVPDDVPDARWPPSRQGARLLSCERIADLEPLPDFVGDMGAAYEIVEWLRKAGHFYYRHFAITWLEYEGRKMAAAFSDWWWLITYADWPEVLGRAVVEAVIRRRGDDHNQDTTGTT